MLCRDFMAIKCAQGREKHSARYTAGAQHVATTRWLRGHQGEMGGSPPRATGGGQRIRYGQSLPRARAGLAESRAPFCPGAPECQGRAERVRPVANSCDRFLPAMLFSRPSFSWARTPSLLISWGRSRTAGVTSAALP